GITLFGLTASLPLALVGLAVAGASDAISGIFRMAMWNRSVPDALRGRLASIEMISYSSGPLLGDFESGSVAAAFGGRLSVAAGRRPRRGWPRRPVRRPGRQWPATPAPWRRRPRARARRWGPAAWWPGRCR